MIGFIGDIHANYRIVFERVLDKKDVLSWVQVGDLGQEDKKYPDFPCVFHFISGNHENWDEIEAMDQGKGPQHLVHIQNGSIAEIQGVRILGFGGNYSSRFFKFKKADLPEGRRRHFVEEEFEKAKEAKDIDILITHEAPVSFLTRNHEAGQPIINEIIKAVKPKLHFFGHHHYACEKIYEGVQSYGLGFGTIDYVKLNPSDMSVKREAL